MKKNFFYAVVVIMMTLCFASCDNKYDQEELPAPATSDIKKVYCRVNANTYQANGVMQTRAAAVERLDGKLTATSRHEAVFFLDGDTIYKKNYVVLNTIEARGVLKPHYAKTLESFKEQNLKMTDTSFEDGRQGKFIKFQEGDGHNFYYTFILDNEVESDTFQIWNPTKNKFESFKRCINEIENLEFLSQRVTDLERDSAGWHAYSLVHSYAGMLSEGPNNGFQYDVTLPLVWVWKGSDKPDYPDEEPEIIVYEDGDEGFDFVNDSTSQSWKDITPTLSDGTKGKTDRIAVLLKNTIQSPEYQIKTVEDLSYTEKDMLKYDEVTEGASYEKENKISVTPFVKTVKTVTDKCDAIYKLHREGRPIFTDSLGGKHYLPERSWTATDDGWTDKSMDPTENFERKLLTSHIIATFNEHNHAAKGDVELRKVKGEDIKIVGFDYPEDEKGIEAIVPNESYKTWRNQYTVFSNGKKEFNGKVSTTLYLKTIVPEKQTITVTDWEISDLSAQSYNATRTDSRADKQETGDFTIYTWSKNYVTRTNKSSDKFTTNYDGTVIFKDQYGKEVEFISLAVKQEDKGGVKTLQTLPEADGYERKSMTTSIAVTETHTSTSANHTAEVEFHKAKPEAPKLVGYEYENFAIKTVVANKQYFTYCTRYAVKSDNSRENLGTYGTDLYISVTEPAKQTITVTDWNINDLTAVLGGAVAKGSREDKKDEGTFKISKSEKSYVTKTNKSECKFVISYEGTVTFTDKFGKEVNFKGIEFSTKDLGGVKTLQSLPEQNEMERKSMTSTITVTVISTDNANYNGVVEFQKAVEKEELTDWKVTSQDLVYTGNGNWTSTTSVTYVWKLAGSKTETYKTGLTWNIVGEAKSQIILDEAKADYRTLNAGSETSSTSTNGNITVVTKKKAYSEDYTTLTDKYTTTTQTASYKSTVGGKTIAFDFLAPTSMVVAHKDGSLVNGNRTTTKNGTEYDVYDHTGSVTANVMSSKGNQTESATDIKEVLVKKVVEPEHPEWGAPVSLAGSTLVYHKGVGDSQQGAFHKCLIVKYEKGLLVVTTHSYGMDGNGWNPNDFEYTNEDFYYYGQKYYGKTLTSSAKINSAALRGSKWDPALITLDGSGWVYTCIDGYTVNMSQNLALTAGIKNFNGETTAANNPFLNYFYKLSDDKVLTIYNSKGVAIKSFK